MREKGSNIPLCERRFLVYKRLRAHFTDRTFLWKRAFNQVLRNVIYRALVVHSCRPVTRSIPSKQARALEVLRHVDCTGNRGDRIGHTVDEENREGCSDILEACIVVSG